MAADRGCGIHGGDNLNALDAQELATFVVEACMIMVTVRIMLGRKDVQDSTHNSNAKHLQWMRLTLECQQLLEEGDELTGVVHVWTRQIEVL